MKTRLSSNSIKKNHGIKLLLEGSHQSHCNTLIGYNRIPNKYDHFHDKTYVQSFSKNRIFSQGRREDRFDLIEKFFMIRRPINIEARRIPKTPVPRRNFYSL